MIQIKGDIPVTIDQLLDSLKIAVNPDVNSTHSKQDVVLDPSSINTLLDYIDELKDNIDDLEADLSND